MASDLGKYSTTTAAISSNTTTTIATPANTTFQKIYVWYVGLDTTVAGTTTTAKVQSNGGAVVAGVWATTAVGHQSDYFQFPFKDYAGLELPIGKALEVVTAGGAAATLTLTAVYEVRG